MSETEKDRVPPVEEPLVPPSPAAIEQLAEGRDLIGAERRIGEIPGRTRQERVQRIVVYTVLFSLAILFFIPFVWSVSTSLKTQQEAVRFSLFPEHPTLEDHVAEQPLPPLVLAHHVVEQARTPLPELVDALQHTVFAVGGAGGFGGAHDCPALRS